MAKWASGELRKIAAADELQVSPLRDDRITYRAPTTIWSIALDNSLYVRAYNGQNSHWYKDAVRQRAGRISAAGMTSDVVFEPISGSINDRIDDAYRQKYHGSPYLDHMISAPVRSATLKVEPLVASAKDHL